MMSSVRYSNVNKRVFEKNRLYDLLEVKFLDYTNIVCPDNTILHFYLLLR